MFEFRMNIYTLNSIYIPWTKLIFSHLTKVNKRMLCRLTFSAVLFNANFRHSVHTEHHTDTTGDAIYTSLIKLIHVWTDSIPTVTGTRLGFSLSTPS